MGTNLVSDAASPTTERRRVRSSDTLTALDIQLKAVMETCDVQSLVITDLDGTPIASAGELEDLFALASFAATVLREIPLGCALTTTRGFVQVELVRVGPRMVAVAAHARFGVPSPAGVSRAVQGATRILRSGVSVRRPHLEA